MARVWRGTTIRKLFGKYSKLKNGCSIQIANLIGRYSIHYYESMNICTCLVFVECPACLQRICDKDWQKLSKVFASSLCLSVVNPATLSPAVWASGPHHVCKLGGEAQGGRLHAAHHELQLRLPYLQRAGAAALQQVLRRGIRQGDRSAPIATHNLTVTRYGGGTVGFGDACQQSPQNPRRILRAHLRLSAAERIVIFCDRLQFAFDSSFCFCCVIFHIVLAWNSYDVINNNFSPIVLRFDLANS